MEVRIGVRNIAREVTLESDQTAADVHKAVTEAMASTDGILKLTDDRGRTIMIPAAGIGYVDLGPEGKGRVGFGTP